MISSSDHHIHHWSVIIISWSSSSDWMNNEWFHHHSMNDQFIIIIIRSFIIIIIQTDDSSNEWEYLIHLQWLICHLIWWCRIKSDHHHCEWTDWSDHLINDHHHHRFDHHIWTDHLWDCWCWMIIWLICDHLTESISNDHHHHHIITSSNNQKSQICDRRHRSQERRSFVALVAGCSSACLRDFFLWAGPFCSGAVGSAAFLLTISAFALLLPLPCVLEKVGQTANSALLAYLGI